ncbi:hypothetical protein [Thermoflavimicrobium daqui]|uniref:Uncharacterized protein n=1 Tax=Thermoflavimicrobium daqui TaxID=2137476 RepID=A0A364K9A4_9BACL|nr:hypothetical protein [Thermoflavimicrobium daqui]RAL26802.1 hypothetical protein DL897_01750 [Thermoflavimicrobium daqui]
MSKSVSSESRMSIWNIVSLIIILIGILIWIVYFTFPSLQISFDQGTPIWFWTLILHPIGMICGAIAWKRKNHFARFNIITNLIMTFSIFWISFLIVLIYGP